MFAQQAPLIGLRADVQGAECILGSRAHEDRGGGDDGYVTDSTGTFLANEYGRK